MIRGNMPTDGGFLLLNSDERRDLIVKDPRISSLIRPFIGASELINGLQRYCIWIDDKDLDLAFSNDEISSRIEGVRKVRSESSAASTRDYAKYPHKFRQIQGIPSENCIIVPRVSSEGRRYLPVDFRDSSAVVGDRNFVMCDAPLWNLALVASRLHWTWVGAVCARLEMRFSYSNTLGWNAFPVPRLTKIDKTDLTRTAENILLAREAHFPATIADLYGPEAMPDDLRRAHEENDEVLERIYIGRRFRNDTERLEKLFDLYTKMTAFTAPKGTKQGKAA